MRYDDAFADELDKIGFDMPDLGAMQMPSMPSIGPRAGAALGGLAGGGLSYLQQRHDARQGLRPGVNMGQVAAHGIGGAALGGLGGAMLATHRGINSTVNAVKNVPGAVASAPRSFGQWLGVHTPNLASIPQHIPAGLM